MKAGGVIELCLGSLDVTRGLLMMVEAVAWVFGGCYGVQGVACGLLACQSSVRHFTLSYSTL